MSKLEQDKFKQVFFAKGFERYDLLNLTKEEKEQILCNDRIREKIEAFNVDALMKCLVDWDEYHLDFTATTKKIQDYFLKQQKVGNVKQ